MEADAMTKAEWHESDDAGSISGAVAVLLNLLSMCVTMFITLMAVKAATCRAENFELLFLVVLGVPALLIQAVVLLPITLWCAGKSTSGDPGTRPRWSAYVAALLPVVTLAAILTGVVIEGISAESRRRQWFGDANHSRLPIAPAPSELE
jgi:hypothetical protein